METHEVVHAALEWAKSNGYAQRAREDAGGEQDKIEHLKKVVDEWRKTCDAIDRCRQEVQQRELDLRKELEQAQARVKELEGRLAQYDEDFDIEIEHTGQLQIMNNNQSQIIAGLREDLNTAKDARIEAEREAADLRAWRRGLVKPKTVTPKKWPVCLQQSDGHVSYVGSPSYNQMKGVCWFDPRDIFEAADCDAEE